MPPKPFSFQENKWLQFLLGLAVLVNFSGLFVPLMDPDAGVYASVAKNMVLRNNYADLYFQGHDWLDKPHFPFWVTAVFFKLFGIHTWSYKLPGILFVMAGAYYTYLFARQHYNRTVGLWSAIILLTAEHVIISNNDVRAEPFLVGLIMAAIYHFSKALSGNIGWHLVIASILTACAVMTKGLFTVAPIGGAIAGELIIKRNWKQVFHWRWLIAGALIILFITPELYCLWYQFDKHPEKIVFGKTGVSGIHFFLWDSQFGRFLNTGPIKGKGDYFFFLHTLLWAFLPWSPLMYASIVEKLSRETRKTIFRDQEWFSITGSLLTLLIFSLSRFQLPFYSNIIFPLLAILTAQYIWKIRETKKPIFRIIQNCLTFIFVGGGIALGVLYAPRLGAPALLIVIAIIIFLLAFLPRWLKANSNLIALYRTGLATIAVNLFINWFVYPDLLKYQSSTEAAYYINKQQPGVPGVCLNIYAPSFEFYLKDQLIIADSSTLVQPGFARNGIWYVSGEGLNLLKESGIHFTILKELKEYHVTTLTIKFVIKKTRDRLVKKYFLIKLQ